MSSRFLVFGSLLTTLFLSACFGSQSLPSHSSASGVMPEEHLPAEVSLVASFSTLQEDEWAALQSLDAKTAETRGSSKPLVEAFLSAFEENLKASGLDYERDLKPAIGTRFRAVYAVQGNEGSATPSDQEKAPLGQEGPSSTPANYLILTLEDPAQMKAVFSTLVASQQWSEKTVDNRVIYTAQKAQMGLGYASLDEDLLFLASTPEALLETLNLPEEDSLWANSDYQDRLEEITDDFLLYAILYPGRSAASVDFAQIPGGLSSDLVKDQVLVLRAETEGLGLTAYVHGDKTVAKEKGISFDRIPHSKPYLLDQVPSERLVAYMESYGLKQSIEQAQILETESASWDGIRDTARRFFAMDFDQDILSFLDQGYTVTLHRSAQGVVPGVSVFADVRSDLDHAQELVDKLDTQVADLIRTYEAVMPGAFVQEELVLGGETLHQVRFNLAAVDRSTLAPFPASILESSFQFTYGLVGERLLLSNADVWKEGFTSVEASSLYKSLSGRLAEVDEGLILLDATELARFLTDMSSLREQLSLEVPQELGNFTEFLSYFGGFIAQSHTNAYDTVLSGFVNVR